MAACWPWSCRTRRMSDWLAPVGLPSLSRPRGPQSGHLAETSSPTLQVRCGRGPGRHHASPARSRCAPRSGIFPTSWRWIDGEFQEIVNAVAVGVLHSRVGPEVDHLVVIAEMVIVGVPLPG